MADLEIKTSKGSKFLVLLMIFAIIIVVVLSFFKYFVKKDFTLYVKEACNPSTEVCFVHKCEDGDARCSSSPDGIFYYKIIYQKQYKAPACTDADCPSIVCETGDKDCSVYYCSEENLSNFGLEDTCSGQG